MLSSVRTSLLVINLEIFMGLMMVNLVLFMESFSFFNAVIYQEIF
jgi:NADH:ubiquinone oxidoreductase subunit H